MNLVCDALLIMREKARQGGATLNVVYRKSGSSILCYKEHVCIVFVLGHNGSFAENAMLQLNTDFCSSFMPLYQFYLYLYCAITFTFCSFCCLGVADFSRQPAFHV